jgi:hypothetical protein
MSANENQDPDQYSFEQILERLKKSPGSDSSPENGELVTRPDGSQVIRVRRRKRRSHQPHREERLKKHRRHVIEISAALILVLLFALGSGIALLYANSGPFRKGLIEKITAATGANVKLEQFRMNPHSANAALIELEWPQSGVMKKIIARGLDARVAPRSFLGGRMTGDEVVAQELTVLMGAPEQSGDSKMGGATPEASRIHFKRLASSKSRVLFGDPMAPDFSLQNSELSFFPSHNKSVSRLLANRGELVIKGWPKFQMDRAQLEFVDGEVEILGLRLRSQKEGRGILQVAGRVPRAPYRAVDQSSRLLLTAENFPLEEIAGAEIGKLLSGKIDSDSRAAVSQLLLGGREAGPSMSLSFRCAPNSSINLHGLPFLKILSNVLNDDWYKHPVFMGDVVGAVRREGAGVAITNLDLENKERMALKGSFRYGRERAYAGELEIGIPEVVIKASGNRRLDLMFGKPKGNLRWMSLRVSGTAASPADDFEAQYDAAGRGATGDKPAEKVPSFEELTRPE